MSENRLLIDPVLPVWLVAAIICLSFAAASIQYFAARGKLRNRRALAISILRLFSISMLAAFFLNPSIAARKKYSVSPALAILLDTSQSMGQLSLPESGSRLDEARSILEAGENPLLQSLGRKFEAGLYGLSDSLTSLEASDLGGLKAGGRKGDLGEAIKALSGKYSIAVLLSDGSLPWSENPTLNIPVIAVPVGSPAEYRDILIKGIKAPPMAFRGRQVTIDVTIKNYGYSGVSIPVLLKDQEELLTAKNLFFQNSGGEVSVSLSFIPHEAGQKHLSISVPQQAGEIIQNNNQINISIKVVRDKTRILMVSGSPSMNYRFLRTALKSDPSIDLLSFVILRTPSDILNVPMNEQSLIPLPVDTLFTRELSNFDLLIFDNFNYSIYLRPENLESIRSFVEGGGGFAMIGGPNVFNEGPEGLTPIAEILPFRFVGKDFYRRDSPAGVRLNQAGAKHPILLFSDDLPGKENDHLQLWREIPALDGINLVEARSSSMILIESTDAIPWPVMTVSEYGKGRVLAITTDYLWKWYAGLAAGEKSIKPYLELVHRSVRWLTKEPSLEPVQIILPEKASAAGEEVEAIVQFRGDAKSRWPDQAVSFSVIDSDGVNVGARLKPSSRPGESYLYFIPEKGGIYQIEVATPGGKLVESLVVQGHSENLDATPDHDQLKKIASSTGGKYVPKGENLLSEIEEYLRKNERELILEKRIPAWATPFALALLLGLLSFEWYFRRRWGLI